MKAKVYFEIYGKKMCVIVEGKDLEEIRESIRQKIHFHKIERIAEPIDPTVEYLMNMFGMK